MDNLNFSASAIATFLKCSQQYKWHYIDNLPADPGTDNLYAIFGSTFHKVMELTDKFNLSVEEARKFWRPIFYTFFTEAENLNEDDEIDVFLKNGYEVISKAFELRERWVHKTIVVCNEKFFSIRYESKNKFFDKILVRGKADLILKDKIEDIFTIIDWKTGARVEKDIASNIQMTIYIWYIYKTFIQDYKNIHAALVYPKVNRVLFTKRAEEKVQEFFDILESIIERIAKKDFKKEPKLNNKPDDCKFCSFFFSCDKNDP